MATKNASFSRYDAGIGADNAIYKSVTLDKAAIKVSLKML